MEDREARQLLRLLYAYVIEYAPDIPQTISALAEDLAMSMDDPSEEVDQMRREIEVLCV